MFKQSLFGLLFFIALVALAACSPEGPSPACTSEQMVDPFNLIPDGGVIVSSTTPNFSWVYEPEADCWPEEFTVLASVKPFPDDRTGRGIDFIETNDGETTLTPSWTGAFEDCRTYFWTVEVPIHPIGSQYSSVAYFRTDFTGSCEWPAGCPSAEDPPTPTLVRPYAGETVSTLNPGLLWDLADLDCEPEAYHVELSTEADFSTHIIDLTSSGINVHREDTPYLEDCHSYYWRVTAENGTLMSPSHIAQFWTDVNGTCSKPPICDLTDLVADTLVYPIDDAVVTDPKPYLVWNSNLPDCVMPIHGFIVSEHADYSDYVIRGEGEYESAEHPDSSIFSTPFDVYQDCKTYYWRTDNVVWSPSATFHTDFEGRCLPSIPPIADIIDRIRFDCINPKLTVLLFELNQPLQGDFEAHIGDGVWPCEIQSEDPKLLLCAGPWTKENVEAQVSLIDTSNGSEVFIGEIMTPICEIVTPTPCQPPTGGCKAPCNWDQATCECRTPNGICK